MLKLGIDLDGVLVNFNKAFAQKFRLLGYVVPEDYDIDPPKWDWAQDCLDIPQSVVDDVWEDIKSDPYFWRRLEPLKGAQEALLRLENLAKAGHLVTFLTLRSGINSVAQSQEWLHHWGISYPTVIPTPNGKARLAFDLGLTHVVDDYPRILRDYCMHSGALKPYPRIYMVQHPYNEECEAFPLTSVKDVNEMLDMILDGQEEMVA